MIKIPLNCTGCHACAGICPKKCIAMEDAGEGFLFPVIDEKECIQCGQCEKVCPILHEPKKSHCTQASAIKSKNQEERGNSTSGGVFPLLAKTVLSDGGIIYGASYQEDFTVRHIAATDQKMLPFLQGAKYVQSIIGTCFQEIQKQLQSGRTVLFSGTPCQCAGLKTFLKKEYNNLITVDLICHGVPSPKVWQTYIDYRAEKENNGMRPVKINMRSKVSGWSRYSAEFDYGEGKITRIQNNQDLFIKAFIGNICLRPSCSECKAKGVERCTDLTLGDYWGIWNQHPDFDDNKGISIVFVHTKQGRKLLKQLQNQMDYLEVDIQDAYKENVSLVDSSKKHEKRKEFMEEVTAENFEKLVNLYFPKKEAEKLGIIQRIKGKIKRNVKKTKNS